MKIVLISGKARSAKDTTASYVAAELKFREQKTLIIHYADFLKWFCREYLGWDGKKETLQHNGESGRAMLQRVGTEIVRNNNPDSWVQMMIALLKGIYTEYDVVLIPDARFPNEIELLQRAFEEEATVLTMRIERPNFDNGLTQEEKNHSSEIALDDYKFDVYVKNDGDLQRLRETAIDVAKWIIKQ